MSTNMNLTPGAHFCVPKCSCQFSLHGKFKINANWVGFSLQGRCKSSSGLQWREEQ